MRTYGMWAAAAALALSGCVTDGYDSYDSSYGYAQPYDSYPQPYGGSYGRHYDGYSYAPAYGYASPPVVVMPPPVIHRHTTIVTPPPPPPVIYRREVERNVIVREAPRPSFRNDREPERRFREPERRERRVERSSSDAPAGVERRPREQEKPRRYPDDQNRDRRG